ncbi:uncharacterized protein LOC110920219 [Helianthus annuus]|uniref:uncharacterized protein LOC110920219 n=1 Tax=Helianthus annuus TaxID=4232 RepID=UPI000B909850|nr:uncharacterized protein LOC110920219 [Helianthus annuus]
MSSSGSLRSRTARQNQKDKRLAALVAKQIMKVIPQIVSDLHENTSKSSEESRTDSPKYLKMGDDFLNPFSDVFTYTSGTGENTTSDNTNTSAPNPNHRKTIADSLSVDNAYGTYNKSPKFMAIEEYNRWAPRFEDWLKAFAYPSWKCLKSGFNLGRSDCENLVKNDQESFIAEQKCIALLHQSVRDDIISLIDYKDARDLWAKLEKKCVGGAEIEELVDKLFDSLPDEKDCQYFALMLKNTVESTDLTVDLLIERLESHELEIRKTNKVNNSSYQQNVDLYYRGSMIPKTVSPKTAFSAENSNMPNQESPSSGYYGGSSSTSSSQQQKSVPKNMIQCNITIDLNNAQNFSEEAAKQQMVFLASVLESYESLVAGKIRNTNLSKEDYDQIDPEEMELIDIRWCMASAVRRAQRFMEITGRHSIGGPSTKLGFDKSKVTCFKCKKKGHFKRECRNAAADETTNTFHEDYYKRAIYHQNKAKSPRMKQLENAPKEKSRALAVIHHDEGFDWSDLLPEEDAVGYAFMAKIVPFKDTRTEEEKYSYRKMIAQNMKDKIYRTWKEAKSAKRWDAERECYLDPKGNIVVETLIEQLAEEEEERHRMWWGKEAEEKENEKEIQLKKVNDGIIDTTKEFTAERLKKMADKVLAAKELEVDSKTSSKSKSKVSSNDSINGSETIGVTFTSSSDEDSVQSEVVKNVVEKVLKFGSDSTEDGECFLDKYIPKSTSKKNLSEEPTLVMYKMSRSDKLYSDFEFPLENVNVDKLELPRSISRGIMDSGASRHMTGKKTLLYDVRGFNGGYVGFAGNQGGRIVGEGTLSNGIVMFERVNYIAELENNLLSISQICDRICVKGKQQKKSHPGKKENSISRPLERLHMDLFGLVNVKSITGDLYCLVVTDDYSRFPWVTFLQSKDQTFGSLITLFRKIENLYQARIQRIRSDNGTEFKSRKMEFYCDKRGILHEFSAPYTPQQNGVAESYTMPPQNPGDSWRFNYDTLWDSFDMEEELEFFDELDIQRECESSQERFPAESSRRQYRTTNDDEAEREHAPDNQTTVNDNLEPDDRPIFDRGDSDSEGEQVQISNQTNPVSEQDANQNVTNLEGEVDVLGEGSLKIIKVKIQVLDADAVKLKESRDLMEKKKIEDAFSVKYFGKSEKADQD